MASVKVYIRSNHSSPIVWYSSLIGETLTIDFPFIYFPNDRYDRVAVSIGSLSQEMQEKALLKPPGTVYLFTDDIVILPKEGLETILEELEQEVNNHGNH